MLEIRWHGRGGQGVWSGSAVLALAAIKAGKYAQSFPQFGPERGGAPLEGYNRISDRPITLHCSIYEPHMVIVIDPTLLKYPTRILAGIKDGGHLVVNTEEEPQDLRKRLGIKHSVKVWAVDATTIALEEIDRPATNTAMLGALIRAVPVVPMERILEAVRERWPGEVGEKNVRAIRRAYEEVVMG